MLLVVWWLQVVARVLLAAAVARRAVPCRIEAISAMCIGRRLRHTRG
jgi:hypothetical protein